MVLPELPWEELRLDYFKGKKSQLYLDSNGDHQFEKRLKQLSRMQARIKDLKKEYKFKYGMGSKESKYINSFLIREFGKWYMDEYLWLEDKNIENNP